MKQYILFISLTSGLCALAMHDQHILTEYPIDKEIKKQLKTSSDNLKKYKKLRESSGSNHPDTIAAKKTLKNSGTILKESVEIIKKIEEKNLYKLPNTYKAEKAKEIEVLKKIEQLIISAEEDLEKN